MRLLLSALARQDLDDIWAFIADDDIDAADRMIDAITDTFERLLSVPRSGRLRPEIAPEVRSVPVGNYVIFYRVGTDAIAVSHVLHGGRDLPRHAYPATGE